MNIKIIIALVVFAVLALVALQFGNDDGVLPSVEAKSDNKLSELPDFTVYSDVKEKKAAFFDTLYPIIEEENQHILTLRETVIELNALPIETLTPDQIDWLKDLSKHYKIDADVIDQNTFSALLIKVDYVPPSLALTQAAIESGWGSSRFSREGNNIFGQWCFSKGCGMVPSSRDAGKAHEVAEFATVNKAVRSYIRNLNTNQSYELLREKRALLRQDDPAVSGVALAPTLLKYSEEGPKYVSKVNKFIKQNNLQRYNEEFHESLVEIEE